MSISVIVSTYNRPEFLEKVLWGYAVQTDRDFEIVVADDGSGAETTATIERFREESGMGVLHVWHEDDGFRKTLILNRSIVACGGDTLLFTDGDCIPRRDLIATHRRLAEPGRFLAGGYLKLPEQVSAKVRVDDVVAGRITELGWLRAQGWRPGRRALRLTRWNALGALFDALTPTAPRFHGNNASVTREAMLEVNGFEGEMGYGGLDRGVGYRLENLGVRGKQIRHRAVCMHLHHDRPYRNEATLSRNDAILRRIRMDGEVRARDGIAELKEDPSVRIRTR